MKKFFQHISQFFIFERYLSLNLQYCLIFMFSFGIVLMFKVDLNTGLSFIVAAVCIIIISYLKVYDKNLYDKIDKFF